MKELHEESQKIKEFKKMELERLIQRQEIQTQTTGAFKQPQGLKNDKKHEKSGSPNRKAKDEKGATRPNDTKTQSTIKLGLKSVDSSPTANLVTKTIKLRKSAQEEEEAKKNASNSKKKQPNSRPQLIEKQVDSKSPKDLSVSPQQIRKSRQEDYDHNFLAPPLRRSNGLPRNLSLDGEEPRKIGVTSRESDGKGHDDISNRSSL